ncbi:MAG: hypothetical protein WAK67_11550, partial [Xanthobacteraceae bacterium]
MGRYLDVGFGPRATFRIVEQQQGSLSQNSDMRRDVLPQHYSTDCEQNRRLGSNMMEDRFLKRLRKKVRKGLRGWPIATIALYGPNLSQATKVTVGIVPSENAEVEELCDWESGSWRRSRRPRHRPGDIGIYREASSAIGRDDR